MGAAWQLGLVCPEGLDVVAEYERDPEWLTAQQIDEQYKHRPPPKSFTAKYTGTCATCFRTITPGQRVHYGPNGLVHHRHDRSEPEPTICPQCFLTMPCECDE